jgi:HEAT repeat protein
MSKQAFEKKIAALEALRSDPHSAATLAQLRKALHDRNNYVVSRAAGIVGDLQLRALLPDLLGAFDRFLVDAANSDHLCWAKNAILKALNNLDHRDPAVYLKGLAHVQQELFWDELRDSAVTLRGMCALALVSCELDDLTVLTYLTDALVDPETLVRLDVVRAIGRIERPESALLLRLKVLLGDKEPEVIGQCFACLLDLSRRDAVPFVERFLSNPGGAICIEAACALAQAAEPQALAVIRQKWGEWADGELRRAVVVSLGASPLPEAAEFLLSLVSSSPVEIAQDALVALSSSRYRAGFRQRALETVATRSDPVLQSTFAKQFED